MDQIVPAVSGVNPSRAERLLEQLSIVIADDSLAGAYRSMVIKAYRSFMAGDGTRISATSRGAATKAAHAVDAAGVVRGSSSTVVDAGSSIKRKSEATESIDKRPRTGLTLDDLGSVQDGEEGAVVGKNSRSSNRAMMLLQACSQLSTATAAANAKPKSGTRNLLAMLQDRDLSVTASQAEQARAQATKKLGLGAGGFKCGICQEMPVVQCAAPCGHICCAQCWVSWLKTRPTCPTCRAPATTSTISRLSVKK